jgi:hypothetical protein
MIWVFPSDRGSADFRRKQGAVKRVHYRELRIDFIVKERGKIPGRIIIPVMNNDTGDTSDNA